MEQSNSLATLLRLLQEYIFDPILYLLYSLAILVFFWGLFEFMLSLQADKSDNRERGKQHMLWGVIGLTIMLSVSGIIKMIANLFGLDLPVELQ